MTWSVLLLFEIEQRQDAPHATFLYGCMLPVVAQTAQTAPSTTRGPVSASISVVEARLSVDDAAAATVRTGLAGGVLDLAAFGARDLPLLTSLVVGSPETVLQPEPAIAVRQTGIDGGRGIPPGFMTSPTLVESYPLEAPWSPTPLTDAGLVSTATGRLPAEAGLATLRLMSELAGLPFDGAYAERLSRFEAMMPPPGAVGTRVDARFLRPASAGGGDPTFGFEARVFSAPLALVRLVARRRREVLAERALSAAPAGGPIGLATADPVEEAEIQVFDPASGDLILHRLFHRSGGLAVRSRITGGATSLADDLTRRAPADRRRRTANVTRASTEIWRWGDGEAVPATRAGTMRRLVGRDRPRPSRAEWFPKGIGGELDVIERLLDWADDPEVAEIVIVDPFLSAATLTRLVRRIGRHDLSLVVLSSVLNEDPDEFGASADAVALLRTALETHASEFACRLRVLNIVEAAGPAGTAPRPVGQAFHDRYVRVRLQSGGGHTHVLTNSLNKAAGNWPFVLVELPKTVAAQVDAYVDGLLRHVDLASGLRVMATLEWPDAPSSPVGAAAPPRARPVRFEPRLTHDVVRTLAWLRGAPGWARSRWPMGRIDGRREIVLACQARFLFPMGRRIRVKTKLVVAALRRQIDLRPPRTAEELGILLRGFGELGAWSSLSLDHVGRTFRRAPLRRLLPRALRHVSDAAPLRRVGWSGEMELESLLTMPLGRRLLWKTEAAIDAPSTSPSPDHGLTGAIVSALVIDPPTTLAFLCATSSADLREVGHALILEDLHPFGRARSFPGLLRARSLAQRIAGVLHLHRPRSEGGSGYDLDAAIRTLERASWNPDDQAWAMAVALDRAMLRLRQMRHRPGVPAQAIADAEAVAEASAAAAARVWPIDPTDTLLKDLDDIFDGRGEDLVRLATAVGRARKDAGGLWRRILRRFDGCVGLPSFAAADPVARDRELAEAKPESGEAREVALWSAIAYTRLTGTKSLTREASRYRPLLEHCERQVRDPLMQYFRARDWGDRVTRLLDVYHLVYRILDEADRFGLTDGAAYFAGDVGKRADVLLGLTGDEPRGWRSARALLARDRGRRHLSGAARMVGTPPELVAAYLRALDAATHPTPSFNGLEALLDPEARLIPGGDRPLLATLGDALEDILARGRSTSAVDAWWRQFVARPDARHLLGWIGFVSEYASHRSTPQRPDVTPAERLLGFRLGPP